MKELNKFRLKGIAIPESASLEEAAEIVAKCYSNHWIEYDQRYWFLRFSQEVEELAGVIVGDHDDTIEVELLELYSILKNWIAHLSRGEM